MKKNKYTRKLKRVKNKNRVNRLRNQQIVLAPMFILVMIRVGLEKQNTPGKLLARLRLHIEKLDGNPFFPVTDPGLAELEEIADELKNVIVEIAAGNKALIPHRETLIAEAKEMILQLSYHIQYLSQGNEEKIKSAGFDVHKRRRTSQLPGQIMGLVASPVGLGKIMLSWDREPYSTFYIIEKNANPFGEGLWKYFKKSRRVRVIIEGLTPGRCIISGFAVPMEAKMEIQAIS
jgi:hypothetical protein